MAEFNRNANVVWTGNRDGGGKISTASGALKDVAYSFPSRFGQDAGSNPEELIAAAHAACFTQFMIAQFTTAGFTVHEITTDATATMHTYPDGAPRVTKMTLVTRAKIEGIDATKFEEIVANSKQNCPISFALSGIPEIVVDAKLV
jgi:osmotically inducible protein OsmC